MNALTIHEQQPLLPETIIAPLEGNEISRLMQEVITAKEQNVEIALKDTGNRFSPSLIGGDLLNTGYFVLLGLQNLIPAVQHVASIGFATLICGEAGGAINIFVAAISARGATQAYRNKDYLLAARLACDAICYFPIGVIMILSSLSSKFAALGCIGAVFAANPWLMPLLFMLASLPLCYELGVRVLALIKATDLGSKLQDDLAAHSDPKHPFNLASCKNRNDLGAKMEELQADMGVEAGLEVFKLLQMIQNKEPLLAQVEKAKAKVKEWNHSLYLRVFQQTLFLAGFVVCMAALCVQPAVLNATQNFLLAGGNGIAIYMDTAWPFRRNTPMVMPKIEDLEDLP
jgi:hypothetical protein